MTDSQIGVSCYVQIFNMGLLKQLMRYIILVLTLFSVDGCSWFNNAPETIRIAGTTMGTTYSVTVIDPPKDMSKEDLKSDIEAVLLSVNSQMSNWDKNSEISQFNANQIETAQPVSPEMVLVVSAANEIHEKSDGLFDITVMPLTNLWGFGPKNSDDLVPSDEDIATALSLVGQSRLLSLNTSDKTIQKQKGQVSINLSAIAKGYGIDQVAAELTVQGIDRYMVEIGGDLVTAGLNLEGNPWAIGIEKPVFGAQTVELILPVSGFGVATSGDYRNFFEEDGVRYSHIINAKNGRPIRHFTSSVTVLAENAMYADGWATALLAAGQDKGMLFAEKFGLAAFFISTVDEKFVTTASSSFQDLQDTKN